MRNYFEFKKVKDDDDGTFTTHIGAAWVVVAIGAIFAAGIVLGSTTGGK